MKKSFLKFDISLKDPEVIQILKKLPSVEEEEIEEEETMILKKEAQMSLDEIISNTLKDSKNGENLKESEDIIDDTELKIESLKKKEKNGEVAENSNHVEENNDVFLKPSSSGTSKLSKEDKSKVLKTLNKHIYEAFLQDFDSDDSEGDEEFGDSDRDNDDDEDNVDDEDDDEEEEEDEDEEYEDESSQSVDPLFTNAYVIPGEGSGSTAIVVLVQNSTLYVANVGDSRCVLSRNGEAIEMSLDHKPEDIKEKSRIEKAGGEVTIDGRVNGGLNLSRAIGDHDYKKNDKLPQEEQMVIALPDILTHEIDLNKDQFFFLACDGIW